MKSWLLVQLSKPTTGILGVEELIVEWTGEVVQRDLAAVLGDGSGIVRREERLKRSLKALGAAMKLRTPHKVDCTASSGRRLQRSLERK
jgi:hypothetical protein